MSNYRYILRYGLDPTNAPEESIKRLVEFTTQAKAEEVMFLIAPEERSSGHITMAEAAPWIEAIRKAKIELNKNGVEISLNPWTTTYHAGRGRTLHPGQNFRLMVGETGANNGISPCTLSEEWQKYLTDYFVHLARELDPVAIWIEDDWRLHNHGAELGYGGCFCNHCLERFCKMVGEKVTREKVLEKITAPGEPHPLRKQWLELTRASLLEPARKLATALKAAKPTMRLGLMTSDPDMHSIEGRDWTALMDTWSGEKNYLIRPHMAPYTETPPITTPPNHPRHTIANLDKASDIYPELENSPRSGPYSGSHTYTIWEMNSAAMYGSKGITINHFDNMGMNTYYDRGLGKKLGAAKQRLNALMPLGLNDRDARGVKILFSPEIAGYMESRGTGSLNNLKNNSIGWSKVFYILGISHSFTKEIDNNNESIYAVSDQTLRAFSDEQIKKLLAHRVVLDFPSVQYLTKQGYGDLIGVKSTSTAKLNDTAYSYEEVDPGFFGELEAGVKARMCAQRNVDPIGIMELAANARVISNLVKADTTVFSPAASLFTNSLGGRVFCSCYPIDKGQQFYMAYFNRPRQEFFTKLLLELGGESSGVTIVGGHPMQLHSLKTAQGIFCGVTNVIYDTVEKFTLHLNAKEVAGKSFKFLDTSGNWQDFSPEISVKQKWAEVVIETAVKTLETCYLLIS